jgi:translation initiation factor 2 beta subunit (eIF-2beta)/eIF-5
MSDDDLITRYYEGEMCPECGDDEGLVEVKFGEQSYLECKKCGAASNNGEPGGGHTFI